MRVSLDGGMTWQEAPEGVRVEAPMDADDNTSMTFNFTHEGLITDLWDNPPMEACLATSSEEYVDIAARLLESGQ